MLLAPLRPALPPPPPDSPFDAAAILIAEIATGLWLGWLARLPALALPIAGQMMSFLLGLSSVLVPAAGGQEQTALARLFGLAAPVLVFATGLHRLALAALAGSYRVIPPGTLLPAGDAAETVVGGVATCFALAFRLAAPFVIASVLWHVAIGLASRLVPRLQIYIISLPGQILGGFLLLGLVGSALLSTWSEAALQATLRLPGL
jgi:flagellar biosynthetic protein FliR